MSSTYLSRTLGTATNRKKFTISLWFKISNSSSSANLISAGTSYANNMDYLTIGSGGGLSFEAYQGSTSYRLRPNRLFRDTNAWYHLVIAFDSTQSTSSDRMKMYLNGEQITSFSASAYPSLNFEPQYNNNVTHMIGRNLDGSDYFDGSMSHVHFVDGSALAPTVFGSTDSTTGEWKINTSPSYTVGTNGFFILKDGNSVTDQSANSNNFTVGGGTFTKTEDCPSNVFCTMNPLDNYWQGSTFANGNNTITTSASKENYNTSTLAMPSNDAGKYYCEVKMVSASAYTVLGLADKLTTSATSNFKNHTYGYALTSDSGNIINNNNSSSYGVSFTTNDIIGIAVDTDNNKLYFSKNGTWMNSGVPTSGSTGTGAISISATTTNGYYMFASGTRHNDSLQASWNFGNGYFGTSAVSSAGTNASGNGIFEYDVPTGYTALSTKGLNL